LAAEVNGRINIGQARGGFHLAGFIDHSGKKLPALYHVHTGHDPLGPQGPLQLYRDFPYSRQGGIDRWEQDLNNYIFWLRNGNFQIYAQIFDGLNKLIMDLPTSANFICSDPMRYSRNDLEARARYLEFQILVMSELYKRSNKREIIALPVSWITISSEGIQEFSPARI
jgi:hypothetical protein